MQAKDGQDAAKQLGASESLQLASLLKGNPEFDAHLESPQEYMKKQDLGYIALS